MLPFDILENHFRFCPMAKGSDVPADWSDGRRCPFGCEGVWYSADTYDGHARDYSLKHLEDVNKRIAKLEQSGIRLSAEASSADRPIAQTPQQNSSQADSEMEDMDETGPGQSQPMAAEPLQRAAPVDKRLETEVHQISERLRTLEGELGFVRSDSVPSPTAATSSSQTHQPTSAGFVFATGLSSSASAISPPFTPVRSTPANSDNSTMVRKLDLCYRKAETYEGMAMVLNVSFDRLLNQVTEIDTQRRRENETREAQERKIQVSKKNEEDGEELRFKLVPKLTNDGHAQFSRAFFFHGPLLYFPDSARAKQKVENDRGRLWFIGV